MMKETPRTPRRGIAGNVRTQSEGPGNVTAVLFQLIQEGRRYLPGQFPHPALDLQRRVSRALYATFAHFKLHLFFPRQIVQPLFEFLDRHMLVRRYAPASVLARGLLHHLHLGFFRLFIYLRGVELSRARGDIYRRVLVFACLGVVLLQLFIDLA
jgi:hypothetical protein